MPQNQAKQVFHDASFRPTLNTAKSPLALVEGQWSGLGNIRTTDQTLRARWGSTRIGSIVSGAQYRGHWTGLFYGVQTTFVAVYVPVSTKVRVYMSTDQETWTEITREFSGVNPGDTGIGPYSTTRMDDDGLVWFAAVQDRDIKVISYPSGTYNQDVLIFGNKSSYPRAYSKFYGGNTDAITNGSGTSQVAIIEPIAAPTSVQSVPVNVRLMGTETGFFLADKDNTTYHNSAGNFVLADAGTSDTGNYAVLTMGTSSATGDTAVLEDVLAGRKLLSGKQLHIGVETSVLEEFLAKVEIRVGTYSGSFSSAAVIYTPSGTRQGVVASTLGTNIYMLSFDTEEFSSLAANSYDAVEFTFTGGAPGGSRTINIWMVKPGATVASALPGTTLHAVSLYNGGTHTESPGVIYQTNAYPGKIEGLAQFEIPDGYTNLETPTSASLYYSFQAAVPIPTQAQADKGVEAARFYRKRPQDDDYYLVESYGVATYHETAGSPPSAPIWTLIATAESIHRVTMLSREPLSSTVPPSAFHVSVPKARCGIGTSDRLYVGANVTGRPGFMFSAADQPFRFREVNDIDATTGEYVPASAGGLAIQGDIINGMAQVSASAVGLSAATAISVATVYLMGENRTYVTGGKSAGEILQLSDMGIPGCIAPLSISTSRNAVYFLDRESQVRRLFGGQDSILTLDVVDNILKGIPFSKRRYAAGCVANQRFYLAYCPSGSTENNRILVYNEAIAAWESVDTPPKTTEAMYPWLDPTTDKVRLIALMQNVGVSTTLTTYSYDNETDTTELNGNVTITGATFGYHTKTWDFATVANIGTVCDRVENGTITYTVNYMPDQGGQVYTLNLE